MKKYLLFIALTIVCKVAYTQSSNVTLASKWLRGWDFDAIYVSGNYAYCGADSVLYILDVSNPSSIKGVSQVFVNKDITWIYVINSKAYITRSDSGLCIVDVSNPYLPVKMGSCTTTGRALSVKVSGNYAYVAADTAGMRIIDVSNANVPVQVSFFDMGITHAYVADVSGNYAYIAYGNDGLRIVDISNPLNPVAAGFLTTSSFLNVFISGNHAYLLSGGTLHIVNVTNPSLPVQESSTFFAFSSEGIFVSGNYAYISGTTYNFEIWDVTNSFSPAYIGQYNVNIPSLYAAQQIFVNGTTVYCLMGTVNPGDLSSIDIVNVTNPSSPVLLRRYSQPQIFTGICTSGHYVYSGGWAPPGGEMVSIFDIIDPYHPVQVGMFADTLSFNFGTCFYMVKSGNYLYLSGTSTASGNSFGFKIIDVSNPFSPAKVGTFNTNNTYSAGIAVKGNYAYVCHSSLGLLVVDVSNPSLPVQVGSLILTGGFPPNDIFISGNHAYVIDNAARLHIIDITNPTSPADVGNYQLSDTGNDIYAEGNYAYVAVGAVGFQIIDVSNPTSPVLAGTYPAVSTQSAIYKQGNYVYLADALNGMQVVDVSNPANPIQAGYYFDIAIYARNVYADSLHSYLATDEGLYFFNGTPTSTGTPLELNHQFSVFPNPFNSSVTFSFQNPTARTISYSIKNIQDQILYSKHETSYNPTYTKTIDLGFFSEGMYFLEVIIDPEKDGTGGKRMIKKIVKE